MTTTTSPRERLLIPADEPLVLHAVGLGFIVTRAGHLLVWARPDTFEPGDPRWVLAAYIFVPTDEPCSVADGLEAVAGYLDAVASGVREEPVDAVRRLIEHPELHVEWSDLAEQNGWREDAL